MFSEYQQQSIQFQANSPVNTNIPAGGMLNEIACILTMQPTITGANNTAANTGRGDDLALIQSLRLQGETGLPLFDIPGSVVRWAHLLFDNEGVPLETNATLADGATANPSLETVFRLPLWSTQAGKPFDSSYDNTAEPNGLTLTCNWADGPSLNTTMTAGAGGFTVAPALQVFTLESKASSHPFLRKRRYFSQITFSATGPQRVMLEPGAAYRRAIINTRAANGTDQAGSWDIGRLYIGGQLRRTFHEKVLRRATRQRLGINPAIAVTRNTKELADANVLFENAIDGYLSHASDTLRKQGNFFEFNVLTNPTTFTICYEVLEDLRRPEFGGLKSVRSAA